MATAKPKVSLRIRSFFRYCVMTAKPVGMLLIMRPSKSNRPMPVNAAYGLLRSNVYAVLTAV